MFLGWNTFAEEDFQRLLAYVEKGGTLLLARPHISLNIKRNQTSVLPEKSPSLTHLLGNLIHAKSRAVRKVGRGRVVYFPQMTYPCQPEIRSAYEAELCTLAEQSISDECRRGWIRGNDDVNFAVYDWKENHMRTFYILNVDYWSGRASAPAEFTFCSRNYALEIRAGTIEVITASSSVAVMPEGADADVLEIEEESGRVLITVQSDTGSVLRVFAPGHPRCPQKISISAGGVQKIEIAL
jgi:hypothetical protein